MLFSDYVRNVWGYLVKRERERENGAVVTSSSPPPPRPTTNDDAINESVVGRIDFIPSAVSEHL